MKSRRIGLLLLIICFLLWHAAYGQFGINTGFKGGFNWSVVRGDAVSDVESVKRFTGGVSLELDAFLLAIEIDLMYSPRGAQIPDVGEIRLDYLSIPIVVKKRFFPVGIHPFLVAGLEFGYLISAEQNDNSIKSQLRKDDLGMVIGGGLEFGLFGKAIYIEGRYFHALSRMNQDDQFFDVKNRTFQVLFGLLL
jgi:hypothetical protein